jgi:tetratricopeptide (TPR) repeat protein
MQASKWDEAEKELTRAIQRNPSLAVTYLNRGAVFLMKGKSQDAYQDSVKALSLLPQEPLAYEHMAQCLRSLGRLDEALTNYSKAISLAGPNTSKLVYEKGVLLNELNRPVEARREFDRASLLGFTNEWLYYSRGVAFLKEGSVSNAVIQLSNAIVKRPDMADAYFVRAIAFGTAGQYDRADRDMREAIRLNPSLANTMNMK